MSSRSSQVRSGPLPPVDLIADDPGERHLRGDRTFEHLPGELRFGREHHLRGNLGRCAALAVIGP